MNECVSITVELIDNAAIGAEGEDYSVGVSAICEILHFLNASVQKVELSWDDTQTVFRLLSDSAWTVTWTDERISVGSEHEIGTSIIVIDTTENEDLDRASSMTFTNRHGEVLTLPVLHSGRREEFITADGKVLEMSNGKLLVIK